MFRTPKTLKPNETKCLADTLSDEHTRTQNTQRNALKIESKPTSLLPNKLCHTTMGVMANHHEFCDGSEALSNGYIYHWVGFLQAQCSVPPSPESIRSFFLAWNMHVAWAGEKFPKGSVLFWKSVRVGSIGNTVPLYGYGKRRHDEISVYVHYKSAPIPA